jgi:NitT/TauT family transport system ATP-binding protein
MTDAPAVQVEHVGKRFAGSGVAVTALQDVTLDVREGEFVTLFGPSGCGKSTLLRLLAGLADADSGEVRVLGGTPKAASKRKDIAWVPQSPALLPWLDVRGNADLASVVNRAADRHRSAPRELEPVDRLLAEMGIDDVAGSRPGTLSGGMRQRVAIARGFAQGGPLLLMDEPFAALDELTRDVLRAQLLDLWQRHRRTVVFVTHSAAEAVLLSDRVVVMTPRPGRIETIVDIDLPRPRGAGIEDSPAFAAKVTEVRQALAHGWTGR